MTWPADLARALTGCLAEAHDVGQQIAQENQREDQKHRRQVDAADRGDNRADAPQDRFGDPVEEIPDRVDEPVRSVDHVELDQPAQDDGNDQRPHIKRDDRVDELPDGEHGQALRGLRRRKHRKLQSLLRARLASSRAAVQ